MSRAPPPSRLPAGQVLLHVPPPPSEANPRAPSLVTAITRAGVCCLPARKELSQCSSRRLSTSTANPGHVPTRHPPAPTVRTNARIPSIASQRALFWAPADGGEAHGTFHISKIFSKRRTAMNDDHSQLTPALALNPAALPHPQHDEHDPACRRAPRGRHGQRRRYLPHPPSSFPHVWFAVPCPCVLFGVYWESRRRSSAWALHEAVLNITRSWRRTLRSPTPHACAHRPTNHLRPGTKSFRLAALRERGRGTKCAAGVPRCGLYGSLEGESPTPHACAHRPTNHLRPGTKSFRLAALRERGRGTKCAASGVPRCGL